MIKKNTDRVVCYISVKLFASFISSVNDCHPSQRTFSDDRFSGEKWRSGYFEKQDLVSLCVHLGPAVSGQLEYTDASNSSLAAGCGPCISKADGMCQLTVPLHFSPSRCFSALGWCARWSCPCSLRREIPHSSPVYILIWHFHFMHHPSIHIHSFWAFRVGNL